MSALIPPDHPGPTGPPMLSVILPAYQEEAMIPLAARAISEVLDGAGLCYELLFVDDGSRDGTWAEICRAAQQSDRVRGLRLSRNFGKEAAMFAGLEHAAGQCCAILDCDLQHPPEKLVEMYRLWEQGCEVVEGIKEDRGQESPLYGLAANSFYRLMSLASGLNMADASDFKLLDRKVVDALNRMPERGVFFRALSYWVGFERATVSYQVRERQAGQSKWSARSLIRYALTNITSFSSAPMQLVTLLGCLMLAAAAVLGTLSLAQKLSGAALTGFTTVILLQLFTGSIVMLSLGIIGLYIAKIYDEVKGRPRYLISKTCGRGHAP